MVMVQRARVEGAEVAEGGRGRVGAADFGAGGGGVVGASWVGLEEEKVGAARVDGKEGSLAGREDDDLVKGRVLHGGGIRGAVLGEGVVDGLRGRGGVGEGRAVLRGGGVVRRRRATGVHVGMLGLVVK